MTLKGYRSWVVLGILGATLLAWSYFYPSGVAASLLKATLWGVLGTMLIALLVGVVFFFGRMRKKEPKAPEVKKAETPKPPAPPKAPFWGALVDTLTNPYTLFSWVVIGAFVYAHPKLLDGPTWLWIPIIAWALTAYFSWATDASLAGAPGSDKEKKAHPSLNALAKYSRRIAILSTLAAVAYYGVIAPDGSWEKATGTRDAHVMHPPKDMVPPEGLPRNPNFASNKLAGWTVIHGGGNQHYRVPQARFGGQQLVLLADPAREVTNVVDLTIGFGGLNEALDIRLTGSCVPREDKRRWEVSKTCGGDWIDRWRHIGGKFYLEVKEGGGNRYIDIYLYDGNNIPHQNDLEKFLFSPHSPHLMFQLRPKGWRPEHQ